MQSCIFLLWRPSQAIHICSSLHKVSLPINSHDSSFLFSINCDTKVLRTPESRGKRMPHKGYGGNACIITGPSFPTSIHPFTWKNFIIFTLFWRSASLTPSNSMNFVYHTFNYFLAPAAFSLEGSDFCRR